MSGLLALFDDVSAIAKIAAASIDDVVGHAAKAGAKAAGAVIDDAAVAPKYVQGFSPARELPIVGRIAMGSLRNKLLILLPIGLGLSYYAPWMIAPVLALGGFYLCFEGGEKVWHWLTGHGDDADQYSKFDDPKKLEEAKISGAIKTDFILSAEIMTIALAAIPDAGFWSEAATLAIVGIGITALVYGSVAVIVKADDLGLLMGRHGRFKLTRKLGRSIVKFMPGFLSALMVVGTAAMLWVGGSIVLHGMAELGWAVPEHLVEGWAHIVSGVVPTKIEGIINWSAAALMDGIFGLGLGLMALLFWTPIQRLIKRR